MVALLAHLRSVFRADIAEATFFPGVKRERALVTRVGPGQDTVVMKPLLLGTADAG